jgi:hypothetical protein
MLLPLLDADPDLLSRMQSIRDWDGNVSLDAVEKTGFVVELDRSHLRLSRVTIVMSTPPKSLARHGADQSTRESFDAATLASIDKPTEVRGHIALTDLEAGGFLVKIEGTHLDIRRRVVNNGCTVPERHCRQDPARLAGPDRGRHGRLRPLLRLRCGEAE